MSEVLAKDRHLGRRYALGPHPVSLGLSSADCALAYLTGTEVLQVILLNDTEGRRPRDNAGRDWSAEALGQGSPAAPEAAERPEIDAPSEHLLSQQP